MKAQRSPTVRIALVLGKEPRTVTAATAPLVHCLPFQPTIRPPFGSKSVGRVRRKQYIRYRNANQREVHSYRSFPLPISVRWSPKRERTWPLSLSCDFHHLTMWGETSYRASRGRVRDNILGFRLSGKMEGGVRYVRYSAKA